MMLMQQLYHGHGWTITLETATLPDGRTTTKARASFANTAHILAFDEERRLILIREYRPFHGKYLWMIPSGHVDKEADPLIAAQRELQEETGFRAEKISPLWMTSMKENIKNQNFYFLAEKLTKDPLPADDDEMIEVHALPLDEALEKILSSPIVHLPSAFAVLRCMKEGPTMDA